MRHLIFCGALLFCSALPASPSVCAAWLTQVEGDLKTWANDAEILTTSEAYEYAAIAALRRHTERAYAPGEDFSPHYGDLIADYRLPPGFQFEALDELNSAVDALANWGGVVRRTDDASQVYVKPGGKLTLLLNQDASGPEILQTLEFAKLWIEIREQLVAQGQPADRALEEAAYYMYTPQAALVGHSRTALAYLADGRQSGSPLTVSELSKIRNIPLKHAMENAAHLRLFALAARRDPRIAGTPQAVKLKNGADFLQTRIAELITQTMVYTVPRNPLPARSGFPRRYFIPELVGGIEQHFANPLVQRSLAREFSRLYPNALNAPPTPRLPRLFQ